MGRDGVCDPSTKLSMDFNPLSPHGERHGKFGRSRQQFYISIHSPRMGRDRRPRQPQRFAPAFQSTLPAWGETCVPAFRPHPWGNFNPLSPHGERLAVRATPCNRLNFNPLSPHGERPLRYAGSCSTVNFNPLSPHGERPASPWAPCAPQPFQSTLPAWGETTAMPPPLPTR